MLVLLAACSANLRQWPTKKTTSAPAPKVAVVKPITYEHLTTKLVIDDAHFKFNSAELTDHDSMMIDDIAIATYRIHAPVQIYVVGHTDNIGSTEYNKKLGFDRASAVAKWLAEDLMPSEDITITALSEGEAKPISTNSTPGGRAKNRRVEITVSPKGKPTFEIDYQFSVPDSSMHDDFGRLKRE